MSHPPDERAAELLELFFESAQELLQSLNDAALELEKSPGDSEKVRSIRRIVHTLKGDSAAVGFAELSQLAHELEDALASENNVSQNGLSDVALTAADVFGSMLTCYRKRITLPATEPLRKMIRALADSPDGPKSNKKKPAATSGGSGWTEYEKLAFRDAFRQGRQVLVVRAQIDPACGMPIAARQLLLKAVADAGQVLASRPAPGSAEVTKEFQLVLSTDKPPDFIRSRCLIPTIIATVKVNVLKRVQKPSTGSSKSEAAGNNPRKVQSAAAEHPGRTIIRESSPAIEPASPAPASALSAENILRVDARHIDHVLNLVGELIIGKSMLQQSLLEFSRHFPRHALRGRLSDAVAFQARVLNDLQRAVMKVRMVPVEQLFRRFPRMVRDVAKQCGKEVELVMSGQDTDLDKGLLDSISEPLTHLVRNAVSHGVETPEERRKAGKPVQGSIRLNAYHQANQVVVEISDDGRGIDVQKVKSRAIERGLLQAAESARASESEILGFIFRPGFSTADEITEVSGRGVGLDVVQSVLSRLKGSVGLESRPGKGATFRLRLPLTLAIIKALLFRVEQRLYAIPLNSVAEIARASEADLHQVDNREVLQLRNEVLPIIRLGQRPEGGPDSRQGKIFVLVIAVGERKFGLAVNGLEGEEELVIKALDDQAVETDLVSGASILGDGRVVLILNLAAIVDRFAQMRPGSERSLSSGLLVSNSRREQTISRAAGGQL